MTDLIIAACPLAGGLYLLSCDINPLATYLAAFNIIAGAALLWAVWREKRWKHRLVSTSAK